MTAARCIPLLVLAFAFAGKPAKAQGPVVDLFMKDGYAHLYLTGGEDRTVDSILLDLGFGNLVRLDSIWRASGGSAGPNAEGWELIRRKKGGKGWVFRKDLDVPAPPQPPHIVLPDIDWVLPGAALPHMPEPWGINDLKRPSVRRLPDGRYRFWLAQDRDAGKAMLSGSFNRWSTTALPMTRTDSGWIAEVALPPGRYAYKFIVDGYWREDPWNRQTEPDGHYGVNSVWYVPNHRFALAGHPDARRVVVTGSFNGWREKEPQMTRSASGWFLDAWFREGTYAYKFIMDGDWMTDPANPVVRDDGMGNRNSFFAIGDSTTFRLRGFAGAQRVTLAGDFNAWNGTELPMRRVDGGWELGHVLAPGNYGYKFVVDGDWITDPDNPVACGPPDARNSLHVEEPNHRFRLPAKDDIREVLVSGSFNGWADPGYPLQRSGDEWVLDLHLEPGKYTYKLVVNGEWILDPGNPQWQENEYGTGNSVLWIKGPGDETP
jgi:hypothetical protein